MLNIRKDQIHVFRSSQEVGLVHQICTLIRTHFVDARSLGDTALTEWVETAIRRGRAQRFTTSRQLGKFAILAWVFGDGFEDLPWAAHILGSGTRSDIRIERLFQEGVKHSEKEIAGGADDHA